MLICSKLINVMLIFLSRNNGSNELWRHKLVFGFEKVYDRAASCHHTCSICMLKPYSKRLGEDNIWVG